MNSFDDAETPAELLGMLAGAASMCWSDVDKAGDFQPDAASALVDAALERLIELGWAWPNRLPNAPTSAQSYVLLAVDASGRARCALTATPEVPEGWTHPGEIAWVTAPIDVVSNHAHGWPQ